MRYAIFSFDSFRFLKDCVIYYLDFFAELFLFYGCLAGFAEYFPMFLPFYFPCYLVACRRFLFCPSVSFCIDFAGSSFFLPPITILSIILRKLPYFGSFIPSIFLANEKSQYRHYGTSLLLNPLPDPLIYPVFPSDDLHELLSTRPAPLIHPRY